MSDGSSFPQPVVSATEPRRWIAAIVGGVLLGEALWSMLQLLIRDWAAPALANAMGQGPTQNPSAFEPLPLVIAFVEACVAAIVLVLLMSWAQRKTRVVVRTVAAPVAPRAAVPQAPAVVPAARPVAPVSVAPVAASPAMAPPVPVVSAPVSPAQAATVAAPAATVPLATVPVASQPVVAKPAAPPAPKKPKTIYYNSVGEPIEE
jgi:hypothetical protein